MQEKEYDNYMREAITQGKKGIFLTYPNPAVGAVLVKDGQVVARGYHKAAGSPHAEIECLEEASANGIDPAGATMVVTLEPCTHYGTTPPCTNALIEARIGCLVYGAKDPNPTAAGGAQLIADAGIKVIGPVLNQECEDLIADFQVWQTKARPYIILKLACTLDGRIATRDGHSRWISCEESRKKVHELRSKIGKTGGAVLIGGTTFRTDNPLLTARVAGEENSRQPLACIITSRLPREDADFKLLKERPENTIFLVSPAASASVTAEALRKKGCRVEGFAPLAEDTPPFASFFDFMFKELDCPYVLCEGGGRLGLSLLELGLVDEFHLHMAPMILGDADARPLFAGKSLLSLEEAIKMRFCSTSICGEDVHMLLREYKR